MPKATVVVVEKIIDCTGCEHSMTAPKILDEFRDLGMDVMDISDIPGFKGFVLVVRQQALRKS